MTNYYVSTTGQNTDPGTLEKPWRTLAYAESKLSSGDVVYVRGGIYQEYFTINVSDVTFQNYPDEFPIIDGNEEIPGDWIPLVEISSNDVTFDGFEVRESSGNGISIGGYSNNVTVKNCEIHETYRQALQIIHSDNALIEDCNIYKGAKVYYLWDDTKGRPPTITTKYCDGPTFRRCKIHDSYFENIDIDVDTKNATVEYCEIYGSFRVQLYLVNSINNTVRYNLIYGTNNDTGSGIYVNNEAQWSTPILVTNNKIYGNLVANTKVNFWIAGKTGMIVKNVTAYNNTFVESTEFNIRMEGTTGGNHTFKNNIIWETNNTIATLPSGKMECDYNLWSRTPDVDSQGPNDPPYALPKLMKTSGWNDLVGGELIPEDFMLQPDSPAIDKGIPIDGMIYDFFGTPIPQGSAPDIGAIEYTDVSDPCEDVVCPNICIGNDLYSQICDPSTGKCVVDQLIESDSAFCDYDPCEGVVCPDICIGNDLYSQICDPVTGKCVTDQLIESDSVSCKIPTDEETINKYLILGAIGIAGYLMLTMKKNKD